MATRGDPLERFMESGPVVPEKFARRCFPPPWDRGASRLVIPNALSSSLPLISHDAAQGDTRTVVRPVPLAHVFRFRLCKFYQYPPQVCRMGDRCTYAHSDEELKVWNHYKRMQNHGPPPQPHAVPTQRVKPADIRHLCPVVPAVSSRPSYQPKNSTFLERLKEELDVNDITPELTAENYKEKFHKLLCWEEMQHITILHERCDGFYSLKMFVGCIPLEIRRHSLLPHKKYGCLNVGDGDTIAYATQASEAVYLIIHNHKGRQEIKADILRDNYNHSGNNMYICIERHLELPESCEEIEAQFEVKHSFFNTLHKVLDKLSNEVVRRIMPLSKDFIGAVWADGSTASTALNDVPKEYKEILHLNEMKKDQLVPYQVALSCQSGAPPVLISGAFGTGKTCFLSSIAYCFISEAERNHVPARVLICAHHQATADTILQTYFGPMLRHESLPLKVKVIRITSNQYRLSLDKKYEYWCKTMANFKLESCQYLGIQRFVVITTFLTSLHLKELYPQGFFTHILIDEGAQAREPEAVAPLCLADMETKIIIAGDPRQVGPALLVLGKEAREYGLKTSLLERLKARYKDIGAKTNILQANLMKNFRCHELILKFASQMFYKSIVIPSHITSSIQSHPDFPFPLVFVCTSDEEIRNYDQTVNKGEADILMNMLGQHLQQNKKNNICVMSSSRGQVTELRKVKFQHEIPQSVRVLPTFDIQGQEYDSLYISTCEPTHPSGETRNPTKSICDPLIFNTALTRARSLIVSFGNPYLLLSIEEHMNQTYSGGGRCWSQYMLKCLHRGTLIIHDSIIKHPNEQGKYKEKLMLTLESIHPIAAKEHINAGKSGNMETHTATPIAGKATPKQAVAKATPTMVLPLKSLAVSSSCCESTANSPLQSACSHNPNDPTSLSPFKSITGESSNQHCRITPNRITYSKEQVPSFVDMKPLGSSPKKRLRNISNPSSKAEPRTCNSVSGQQILNSPLSRKTSSTKGSWPLEPPSNPQEKFIASPLNPDDYPTLMDAKQQKTPKKKRVFIPSSYQEGVENVPQHTTYFWKYEKKLDTQILERPLTVNTYRETFHHLLCWEEKEHMSILAKRCNGKYLIKVDKQQPACRQSEQTQWLKDPYAVYSCYGTISSADEDDDIISYAKQAAEAAYILLDGRRVHVDFVAFGKYQDGITIGLSKQAFCAIKEWKRPKSENVSFVCDVMFELKHSYFHRQHEALDALPPHVIQQLLPCERVRSNHRRLEIERATSTSLYLDDCGQMQALTAILNQGDNPVIISGPFGTGKTRVLARATYELLRRNKNCIILICAHHQVSADTFIEYFGSLQQEGRFSRRITIARVATMNYHSKTREKFPDYYCSAKHALSWKPKVIVCTLGLSHHLKHIKGITHIFIDEAAQTRETEAIIPLQFAECQTRIVLAGDHCQVGPDVLVLGDEARKYGLSTSLLERLHKNYNQIGETSCSFSLLSNYRSHSGLLMLPSSLFYGSTLQCNVSDGMAHPNAPFPIVFVCSSIENLSTANCKDKDEKEATTLVNEVKKYIWDSWPAVWGERANPPGRACIMTPSATQKRIIVRKMAKSRDNVVDVLKAYEIQGCEFTAVFIGTCEATDERGIPKNTTKTIMNHYVFNTALTRARHLVVAVGNPLQLLDKEEKMCNLNLQNKNFQCWKEYIRRCIECKSFHLPKHVEIDQVEDFTNVLYQRVFSPTESPRNSTTIYESWMPKDSILSAYKKKFESIPECRQSKLRLSRVKGSLSWNVKDSPAIRQSETEFETVDVDSADVYKCRLELHSFSSAEAIPLDTSKRVVQIRGMGNIKGAFHGDVVEVAVFGELPQPKCKGKVVKVIKECHKQALVCKAHKYNPILFCPLDKKYPIISNLPKLSRDLLERKDRSGIVAELCAKDVVIFEPNSLFEGNIPEIKNVIPHSIAQDMLFVVRILLWNPKFRLPLGVVVHALPKGCSAFHAERLLKIEHDVHYDEDDDGIHSDDNVPRSGQTTSTDCAVDTRAFTIDPEDAVNLDDAISLTQKHDSYLLAVHVVNTTKEIAMQEDVDKKAAVRGVSVYGVKRVMNMLPAETRSKLSLLPHKICEVMTVSAIVMKEGKIDIKEIGIKESQIKSCAKLSYRSAQGIMDSTSGSSASFQCTEDYDRDQEQPSLKETLDILFKIAMKLRTDRLGDLVALSYEMDDPNEQDCWQMHLMVEEMMIWANNAIASKLLSAFPECALLRKQNAPNAEEIAATSSTHSRVLGYSHALSQYIQHPSPPQRPLVVTLSTLQLLIDAVKAKKTKLLLNLLTDDSLYPQLSASFSHFRKIQQKAEYISAETDTDPSSYCHCSLKLPVYTHFTSPLRRYADIIVQRMVKSLITGTSCSYEHEEVISMCHRLNNVVRNAKSFEKETKTLRLALEYTQSSKLYEAVITRNTGTDIEISFLDKEMKCIHAKQKRFKVRHLKCKATKIKENAELPTTAEESPSTKENVAVYTWKVKLVSFNDQSSFPYDCDGLSAKSGATRDFTTDLNVPCISMKLYRTLDSGMLKSVLYNVESSPTAVVISPTDWNRLMQLVQNPSEDSFMEITSVLSTSALPATKTIEDQVRSPVVICDVASRMEVYDVVKVWMTWSTREAILSPQLQLIEIAPFFRICLQHNAHPAECFSDSHLDNASKKQYTDLNEYVKLWEKVLLAESAERSVADNHGEIIHDVNLEWPNLAIPKKIDETHYEPTGYVKLALPDAVDKETNPFFKVHVGDLMCVRYGTQLGSNVRAVFHLVVTESKSDGSNVTLLLKVVSRDNCKISERMKPLLHDKCEIQVIAMSPSYQRVYKVLLSLLPHKKKQVSELIKAAARGNDNVILGKLPKKYTVNPDLLNADPLIKTLWTHCKTLNKSQWSAVQLALTKRFQLIQGPPGTGKSETGAHIAYALATGNRIRASGECVLYCAPTNKAVDVVLKNLDRLCSKRKDIRILRVYGHAVEGREFPGPHCEKEAFQVSESEYRQPQWARKYALHCIIRDDPRFVELREMEKMFSDEYKQGHIPGAVLCQEWKRHVDKAEEAVLKETFDIILCTCNEAASKRIVKNLKGKRERESRVLQCIIDESGMAYEPETIVPMSLCEHAVLLGDHKQLQPVIEYKPAKENGLTTSLFERYAKSRETKVCMMLDIQYRMHEEICRFPSDYFYDGKLKTDSSVTSRRNQESKLQFWPRGPKYPIMFCDFVGEEETQLGRSKSNPMEAKKVVQIARVIHQVYKVKLNEIALITPYSAQKRVINSLANDVGLLSTDRKPGLTVATIAESQGDEYGIVILSTVRSQPLAEIINEDHVQPDRSWLLENLGFLTDEHEINVGITRSKYGMIIVGNKTLLKYDDTWKALILHYEERKCVVEDCKFPKREDWDKVE